MKRDRDDTDFPAVRRSFEHRESGCVFCEIPKSRIVGSNSLAYAVRDLYPVTDLHTLIIPKRHVASYFELGRPELNACHELVLGQREELHHTDPSIAGFNLGINDSEVAGQTIFHCYILLVPRRSGDVANPRGGIRHLMPGKGGCPAPIYRTIQKVRLS